jgi:glycosyltransferase involved in cell wall biosynthesis
MDEIWTVSNFSQKSISKISKQPCKVVKLPVPIPNSKTQLTKTHFGVPDEFFLVVTSFDFNSDVRRKNPAGSIRAYLRAFPKARDTMLIIKSVNGTTHPGLLKELQKLAAGRDDIRFMDRTMLSFENNSLLEVADVYLSLHRSEGYGINLIDSMARRTPVVATGYSGNLDFMNEQCSIVVPFEMIDVGSYAGFSVRSQWANPSEEYAAEKLRELYLDRDYVANLGDMAFENVKKNHSLESARSHFKKHFIQGEVK